MYDATLNQTLGPQAFYMLLAIADRPLHGYAIRQQVAHDSENQLLLATGTVYVVLKRLAKEGLVEKIEAQSVSAQVTCRYRITGWGRKRLESEIKRMERSAMHARIKLGQRVF